MNITIQINADQVTCINAVQNRVSILIDLNKIWEECLEKYTNFYVNLDIEIPTLEEERHNWIQTITQTEVIKSFRTDEVQDRTVALIVSYPGKLDTEDKSRTAIGKAIVTSYNIKS